LLELSILKREVMIRQKVWVLLHITRSLCVWYRRQLCSFHCRWQTEYLTYTENCRHV